MCRYDTFILRNLVKIVKLFRYQGPHPTPAPMGVIFLHAKYHLRWCSVSPLRSEKPQNRHLTELNTDAFASRMLVATSLLMEKESMAKLHTTVYGVLFFDSQCSCWGGGS